MAKKAKKRGVKPGTKRGPYKVAKRKRNRNTPINLKDYTERFMAATDPPKYTPAPILTLCGQLEDAILLLENRISNSIAKINSLM